MTTSNILNKILKTKRDEISTLLASKTMDQWAKLASEGDTVRDFYAAMTKAPTGRLNLIAEIKRASPSAGIICENFDPLSIARQYEKAGASAISVLTDEVYFSGSLEYLKIARQAVSLPVIRKDFIIDPCQVYQSRAAGADAILLIAAALEPMQLLSLLTLANSLELACLVEVHNTGELDEVLDIAGERFSDGNLLGINNRDLTTFNVDIQTTVRLAKMVDDNIAIISESGIKTRADVEQLASCGAAGLLVGQTLMQSDDIQAEIEKLIGRENQGNS